jgi:hypothetical protein
MSKIANANHFPAMLLLGRLDFIEVSSLSETCSDFTTKNAPLKIPYAFHRRAFSNLLSIICSRPMISPKSNPHNGNAGFEAAHESGSHNTRSGLQERRVFEGRQQSRENYIPGRDRVSIPNENHGCGDRNQHPCFKPETGEMVSVVHGYRHGFPGYATLRPRRPARAFAAQRHAIPPAAPAPLPSMLGTARRTSSGDSKNVGG